MTPSRWYVVMVDRYGVQLECIDAPSSAAAKQTALDLAHRQDFEDRAQVVAYQASADPDVVAEELVTFTAPDARQGDLFTC